MAAGLNDPVNAPEWTARERLANPLCRTLLRERPAANHRSAGRLTDVVIDYMLDNLPLVLAAAQEAGKAEGGDPGRRKPRGPIVQTWWIVG